MHAIVGHNEFAAQPGKSKLRQFNKIALVIHNQNTRRHGDNLAWIAPNAKAGGLNPGDELETEKARLAARLENCEGSYFSLPSAALTASKFGRSFGVAVCSLYCTTPALSMTNAARADVSPTPASIGNTTS